MKAKIYFFLLAIFIFPSALAFPQEKSSTNPQVSCQKFDELEANKIAVGDTNNDGKIDALDLPTNNGDLQASGYLKTSQGICIKDNCKNKWPALRCVEYEGRPAGESGNNYCNSIEKTCFNVWVGSGASYFNECSSIPKSEHTTRCCWVE